jgi:uncharacterized protein YndB with AHSA1/START domain
MDKPKFVYVIYISTTPEKVWNALTDPGITRQYWWNHRNASDWKAGSKWEHRDFDDASLVDVVGKVVESTPPRRLVITWAAPEDASNESRHSRVTFDLEPYNDTVRLTVRHEELDSDVLRRISRGWPAVLSSLKSLLETGEPLSISTKRGTLQE